MSLVQIEIGIAPVFAVVHLGLFNDDEKISR